MNKVTTIHLNGKSYELEENGYEALRAYLDQAAAKLADNPDKDEIMADFEQAIAEKCDAYLSAHKDVVTAQEIEEVLRKIGPVESGGDGNEGGAATAAPSGKRLYRIRAGRWLGGVCTGFAAYCNMDIVLVRVLVIILVAISHGLGGAVYVLLWIMLPEADTADKIASAHGRPPFTAADFMNRVSQEYANVKESAYTRHEAHLQERAARHRARAERHRERDERRRARYESHGLARGGAARFFSVLIALFIAAAGIAWIASITVFVTHGIIFGYAFGAGQPVWVSLLFITCIYAIIVSFLKAIRSEVRDVRTGDEVVGAVAIIAIVLLAYTSIRLFPEVHAYWNAATAYLRSVKQ